MKFNRPNDPAITPAEMAYYQTPATAPSTWRADLARIGIVSGVAFVLGTFATGTAVIFWRSWQTVGVGMWLTVLLSLVPLAVYAIRTYTDLFLPGLRDGEPGTRLTKRACMLSMTPC